MRIRIVIIIALLVFIFWNTFLWMNYRFSEPESFYAHGYLVPLVSAYLIFRKKDALRSLPWEVEYSGLFLIVFSLLVHVFASFFEINFLSGLSFVAVLFGLVIYNCGFRILGSILFCLFFLLFMVPMPNTLTLGASFYLKLVAAKIASFLISSLIPLKSAGSVVYLPNGVLTVGSPCSGLKSLISLSALSLLFAYLTKFNLRKKTVFFLLALPIAFISNIFRIMLLIFVFYVYGSDVAMGWFHDFSGMLVFIFAFLGLVALRKVFLIWPEKLIH